MLHSGQAELFAANYETALSTIEAEINSSLSPTGSCEPSKVDCVFLCRLRYIYIPISLQAIQRVLMYSWGQQKKHSPERIFFREQILRSAGFQDTFADVKEQENLKALDLLPAVLRCAEPSCFGHMVLGKRQWQLWASAFRPRSPMSDNQSVVGTWTALRLLPDLWLTQT